VALALVPYAADAAGRLHLWVGVADVRPAPALSWRLDGRPVEPRPLRPLTPVPAGNAAATVRFFGESPSGRKTGSDSPRAPESKAPGAR
jgi:hypothetical protein